ncbi:MAG: hypothetical protein GQE15_32805 [Archangiaceae bacterium]|nr:hypothetical protein [Archangiaceae bacterium]
MKDELELDAQLIKGSGGIFEVAVDGQIVSKKALHGFPSELEIVNAVSKALEQP